jgi:ADP-ribose pyrophosphatase YjhB (NUDIX family)
MLQCTNESSNLIGFGVTATLTQLIAALEAAAGDPRTGLGTELFQFVSRMAPCANVDLLIQDERHRTLLTWRDDDLFGIGWHLPGGIIRYKETAADRVRACARDELATEVSFDPAPVFVSETIREQSDRGHLISLLYRCRLRSLPDEARRASAFPPAPGQWQWHDAPPMGLLGVHRIYARFF